MCLPNSFQFYVFKGFEGHKTTEVPLCHHCAKKGLCAPQAMKWKSVIKLLLQEEFTELSIKDIGSL